MLRDIPRIAASLDLGGMAEKEAIATAAFSGLLATFVDRSTWTRAGRVFHVEQASIIVKATLGNAAVQGVALTDVEPAKLIVFARVLPGDPQYGVQRVVEFRGFASRNLIRQHYSVTRYRTVPGYKVAVKRLKPLIDLLWWLQDGGHLNGRTISHAADAAAPAQAGDEGGSGGTVAVPGAAGHAE